MATFKELQAEAHRRGFTVERGSGARTFGARSGYILTARGLWSRYGSLSDLEAAITRKGYDYDELRRRESEAQR